MISMTFDQAKESSGKPLDLAKQRAIPQIRQEEPNAPTMIDCEMRSDVVDYTVQDTVNENRSEAITNPVEIQNRKRLRKKVELEVDEEMEQQFLDGDQDGDNQVKSIEDEQNDICRDRKILVDAEDGGDSVNEDQISVEFASDDEDS